MAATATSLGLVVLVYVWVISAGTMSHWPGSGYYCGLLGDAFLHRQTYLRLMPDPRLFGPDPYDPVTNAPYRLHDALLFNGRYYLFWGPVPSLILAGLYIATGLPAASDSQLVFTFTVGVLLFSTSLLWHLGNRYFAGLPSWAFAMAVIMVGLCHPTLYTLARPAVYEAAIMGAQCFLIGGVLWASLALSAKRGVGPWCLLAGLFWALAGGCRVSMFPPAAVLSVALAFVLYRRSGLSIRTAATLTSLFAPLAIGVLGTLWYNKVRFGSYTDSGFEYQLAGMNVHALMTGSGGLLSLAYAPANAVAYLFTLPRLIRQFPFLIAKAEFPRLFYPNRAIPLGYGAEPVTGLAVADPFVWLALAPAVMCVSNYWTRRIDPVAGTSRFDERPILAISLLLLAAGAAAAVPALTFPAGTMRYINDFSHLFILAAVLGLWSIILGVRDNPVLRRALVGLSWMLAAVSVGISLMLGITGYYNHFELHNPALFQALRALFSWGNPER